MIALFRNRKKLDKPNKKIIIVTIVLLVFSIVTLITTRSLSPIETMFKDTVANIEYYLVKTPIQYVGNLFSEYNALKDVYEENAMLKEQLDKYAREVANNDVLASELNQLKEITKIDYLPTDYTISYTKVISRDVESWNNQVTIDLGESAGIHEGMAVVSSQGMIGTVTTTSKISSTVSLLCDEKPSSQLPVMVLSGDKQYYGLLNEYSISDKCYHLTMLSDVDKLEKGAKVVTSGLGGAGKSPKGILVGTVENYISQNSSESVCLVKPSVDFNNLNYVAVVKRVNKK